MRLTNRMLRNIILQEVANFGDMESTEDRAKDTEELDADEVGGDKALEKTIDYIKALKIEETRLRRRLARIAEARRRLRGNV